MTWYDEMTWCDGCGVEITGYPCWQTGAPTAAVNAPKASPVYVASAWSSMRSNGVRGQSPHPPLPAIWLEITSWQTSCWQITPRIVSAPTGICTCPG
jgi:hypothetical protein